MPTPITLDALRVLDAIDRKKSFAGAAEALHRVPSAISYTVNKLEQELGVELFDRRRRRAVLTAAGRLLLDQGRRLLQASDDLAQKTRAVASGWEAELRIAVETVLGFSRIWELVHEFQENGHITELVLYEEVLGGSWEALIAQRCDLIIGAEGTPPAGGLLTQPLGQLHSVFAVAADHPLCARPQPLSAEDIRDYPTIVVPDSSRYAPARSIGLLDGRSRLAVPNTAHKIDAQKRGLGVGFLPLHRIRRELQAGELKVLELQVPAAKATLSAAWRRGDHGKALQWFIARLKDVDWFADA